MVLVISDIYIKDRDLRCPQKITGFVTHTTLDLLINYKEYNFFHVKNLHLRTLKLQSPAIYQFLRWGIKNT